MWSKFIDIFNAHFKDSLNHMQRNIFCWYIWFNYNIVLYVDNTYGALIKMDNLGEIRISHSRMAHLTYMAFHMYQS
jgi:hypothetical protein